MFDNHTLNAYHFDVCFVLSVGNIVMKEKHLAVESLHSGGKTANKKVKQIFI